MSSRVFRFGALTLCLAATALWALPAAAQSSIGVAAAVKNQVQGVRGGASRTLAVKGSLFSDDHVKTGGSSLAQLLFNDQTTFTVGSDSEAVLSRVYHPRQGFGHLVMKALAGAFRFVSGAQTPNNYKIEFPFGYITVRGTIVDLLNWPNRSVVFLDQGAITVFVYATHTHYDLDKPGTMLVVYSDGHVDGPMTWDFTLMDINGSTPFPLFATELANLAGQIQQYDSQKDLNDILSTRSGSGNSSGPPFVYTGCASC